MTYRYLNPNPFTYEEARFFIGLRVQFVEDTKTTRFVRFELEEAFFKAGQVVTVRAVHDYGQGCMLAIYEGDDLVRAFDRDEFFLYFSPLSFPCQGQFAENLGGPAPGGRGFRDCLPIERSVP